MKLHFNSLSTAALCVFILVCGATAGDIALSLNLELNNPGDMNAGGTWTAVAKAEERGISALVMRFEDTSLNFNPATGFLTPVGFEVETSAVFGSRLELIQGDDLSNPTLDVGVIGGTYPSAYVDDPNLVILGANPDLGSFTGGALMATGTFNPGDIPTWFDDGNDASDGNLFIDAAGTVIRAENVFTTVRYVVPEPSSVAMIGLISGGLYFARRFFVV